MLLAIDIGNTTIGFAVIHKTGNIVSVAIIDTDAKSSKIKAVVAKILKAQPISRAHHLFCCAQSFKDAGRYVKKDGTGSYYRTRHGGTY